MIKMMIIRKIMALVVLMWTLTETNPVFGLDSATHVKPRPIEIKRSLLVCLSVAPSVFVVQTVLHESAHAVTALALGHEVTQYHPFPGSDGKHFVWGYVAYRYSHRPDRLERAVIMGMPFATNSALFIMSDVIVGSMKPSIIRPLMWIFGMVGPWVDFVQNMNGFSPNNDHVRLAGFLRIDLGTFTVMGNVIAAVGLWRIICRFREIFLGHERPRRSGFANRGGWHWTPMFGIDSGNGGALAGMSARF